jgi:hypothetical protein
MKCIACYLAILCLIAMFLVAGLWQYGQGHTESGAWLLFFAIVAAFSGSCKDKQ